jgi:hypothetical protein
MTDKANNGNDETLAFLQAEYTSLRGEIVKRLELGQRLLEITLVSAAAILTINLAGDEFARVLLAYPVLVMFLAFAGLHSALQVRILATYIKTEIEPRFRWRHDGEDAAVGYEAWLVAHAPREEQRLGIFSSIFMFTGTQVLVFSLGVVEAVTGTWVHPVDIVLIFVGVVVIVVTAAVLIGYLGYRR